MDHPNSPAVRLVTSREWTLDRLLAAGARFQTVDRISANSGTPEQITSTIKDYEQRNVPLVVQDLHHHPAWPEFFTPEWLESNYGSQVVEVRNVHGKRFDKESTVTELIDSLRNASKFADQEEHERLYGKDMHCPSEWRSWIRASGVLPNVVTPGATGDILPEGVETLMSYLGISDTYTPLHKDPCASYGQNLMCYTEDGSSSFWFMTKPWDCDVVAGYFRRKLGHELDWEDHVATVEELAEAPFDVFVLEQKLGDLVLVPPRSFHQVVNAGGMTIKTSWSRMSIRSLEIALFHELPIYRRVCRPEVYRVRRTIYDTLVQRTTALEMLVHDTPDSTPASVNPLCKEIARLIELLDDVLEQEYSTQHRRLRQVTNSFVPGGHGHVCDFCGADIFLSFFQCDSCSSGDGSEDPICLCPACFVEGRTCKCRSMEPVKCGNFRELLRNRNNAMLKLRDAREAELYDEDPEELSEEHFIDSVKTTFQAAMLLLDKRRDILSSQKTTRTCTLVRKKAKSHVVDGWAIIMCKECHSGRCFVHILEAGIHSSEALMIAEHDKTFGKWHSAHTSRQKRYENVVLGLIRAMKMGDKTEISDRLVYFARTFQNARPLSEQVSPGFYDKEVPNPEEVDQLDPVLVTDSEHTSLQTREETPAQPLPYRLPSGTPAVPAMTESSSRKRKRSSKPPNPKVGPEPSQPPAEDRSTDRLPQITSSSKMLRMDCVLITTLPPAPRKKTALSETPGDEDGRSQTKTTMRNTEKRRGKQREAAPTSRPPLPSESRSLADEPMHSRSHSVSSLRPPLFEPEGDLDPVKVETVKVHAQEAETDGEDDSDDEVLVSVPHRRQRVESDSPTPVDPPPTSSSAPSPYSEQRPYYTVVNVKPRLPGSGIRFAPNQHQIAKTPAAIYDRSRVRQPIAGPSNQTTRVGPPKHRLPRREEPKLRPAAELNPPRPPPPCPGLAALEARVNTFVDENQKLRDELATAKSELATTKDELVSALARIDTVERSLYGLMTLERKLEELQGTYEKLSSLLTDGSIFDTEKFHLATQAGVKECFSYYWPSVKNDLKAQLWKETPEVVKEHVRKEIGKVMDEVMSVRSELVALKQTSTAIGGAQNGDTAIAELKRIIQRVEKKQEELEAKASRIENAQELEKTRRDSTPSVPRLTSSNTGNMHPPHLPSKPPSPWPDEPQQDPRRPGAQTPPAAFDQNSSPFQQGQDEGEADLLQTGPAQDPRDGAVLSLSLPILLPSPTSSLLPGSHLSQSTPIHTSPVYTQSSTSAPSTPAFTQSVHVDRPPRAAQPETNTFSPTMTIDSESPLVANPPPGPLQNLSIRPIDDLCSESIRTQFPAGMLPDRAAPPLAHNRPPSVTNSIQPPRSTPLGANGSLPPQDALTPSSSRITLDNAAASPTPTSFHPRFFATSFDFDGQHTPVETHEDPGQRQNQGERGKAAQKRKASEALPHPRPPKSPKTQKAEGSGRGTKGGVSGTVQTKGEGKKKRRKKKKVKLNGQPRSSNPHHGGNGAEGTGDRDGGGAEDGEIRG